MDECLSEFIIESLENLARLDQEIVTLENNPDDQQILQAIFRTVHTIKGTCGMLKLQRLEKVAHIAENVLGQMREGALPVSAAATSAILAAVDVFKEILQGLEKTGSEPTGDDSAVIARLEEIAKGPKGGAPEPQAAEPQARATEERVAGASIVDQSLRVNVGIIDQLINAVGELVLTRNQLIQLVQAEDESKFLTPIQQLNRVTSGLQEVVMKTRMQPIGNAWSKLPRILRDLSQSMQKKINLVMTGAETEVDRQILQAVQDPLIHCVRNSADHGIESPQARRAAGKTEMGTISLNSYHEGGHIIIEIKDDGAGINVEAVREKAIAKGLIDRETANALPESQVFRLIFEPGFSTKENVTEVSGRGVGMDVVRTNVETIGGTVDVFSVRGSGTTIRIKIPLTLAIIPALIVGVRSSKEEVFAIPQVGIVELVRVTENNRHLIEEIHGSKILRLRDQLLPLLKLSQILGLDAAGADSRKDSERDLSIVVAQVGDLQFGLCVDEIFDTQEIVVKPVGRLVRDINLYAGTTILGDGRVILIADLGRIAAKALLYAEKAREQDKAKTERSFIGGEKTALLLFRAGQDSAPLAVPLALVARLEDFAVSKIERADDRFFVQYRKSLLPLIPSKAQIDIEKAKASGRATLPALIFSDQRRAMGLMVDEILDVVEEVLSIEASSGHAGILGTAIVSGKVTEIIDTYHFLRLAYPDWFRDQEKKKQAEKKRVLLAEDSRFFQDLIRPILEAHGFEVAVASDGGQALEYLETGAPFDIVVSDIEMPVLDGIGLAGRVRSDPRWRSLPLLALTSLASPPDMEKGLAAGFSEYLIKFDQEKLLAAIDRQLNPQPARSRAAELAQEGGAT